MNITSTVKRPLETTQVDDSVRVALKESTPESPVFFVRTPEGYANCRLGKDAYQSEELGEIVKPLGRLAALFSKELFPQHEGIISGIGYGFGFREKLSDFESDMNFANGLAAMKPMVKLLKLGKDFLPNFVNSTFDVVDAGLTVVIAIKNESEPKVDTIKTAFLANYTGTPLAAYLGPAWSLADAFCNELDADPYSLGGSTTDVETISKRLLKQLEEPTTAQSILNGYV